MAGQARQDTDAINRTFGTSPSSKTVWQKRVCGGGLLYKTCFSGPKRGPNSKNVNPIFSCQKGTFSYDPEPYRHEEGLYRSDPELYCSEVGLHIVRSQPSERWSVTSREFSAHLTATSPQNFLGIFGTPSAFVRKYSILRELRFITLLLFPVFSNQIVCFSIWARHLIFSVVIRMG